VFACWQQGTGHPLLAARPQVNALEEDDDLGALRGYAQDSGEGRWTVEAAIDHAVPLPVITAALFARFSSRQDDSPAMKMIAALRNQFGGHAVTSSAGSTETGADSPGADAGAPSSEPGDPAESQGRGSSGTVPSTDA
jgi:6-phosphogluconate dehydrogenase